MKKGWEWDIIKISGCHDNYFYYPAKKLDEKLREKAEETNHLAEELAVELL